MAETTRRVEEDICHTGEFMKLTKHHGLGNDFLIHLVDNQAPATNSPEVGARNPATRKGLAASDIGPEHARDWCDRKTGIGADGLMVATNKTSDNHFSMKLWNADGSRAELSGNGLRCLGQALAHHTGLTQFEVDTDAGPRSIIVHPSNEGNDQDTVEVTVSMGVVTASGETFDGWPSLGLEVGNQLGVDVGNPHLVVQVDDPSLVDLAKVGPVVEASFGNGVNLEVVSVRGRAEVSMRVWERGVGLTQACGSGAVATAYAAHQWGLVDNRVDVVMPGGAVTVELDGAESLLKGPATYVADVEV